MEPIIDSHVWLGEEHHLRLTPHDLLGRMDASHVSLSIARPMGSELVIHNHAGNQRVLHAGPRVRGLATANPWHGPEALTLLAEARAHGAVGLYLHPTRQGFMPTDPIAKPLLDFSAEASLPVVFHTGTYIQSDVLAVSEIARRYPKLPILCDSAGWTDMWFELPNLLADLPNLHFIASMIWARAIANTIKSHGPSRILFGSGEPRDSLPASLARINRLELKDEDRRALLHDNAKRIFNLP